eukprot:3237868-Prymnesium_polylepis.1
MALTLSQGTPACAELDHPPLAQPILPCPQPACHQIQPAAVACATRRASVQLHAVWQRGRCGTGIARRTTDAPVRRRQKLMGQRVRATDLRWMPLRRDVARAISPSTRRGKKQAAAAAGSTAGAPQVRAMGES